jgi:hypothetical protein
MALNQFPRRSFVGSSTLQTFTGDGTTTAFTLSSAQTQNEVFLFVDDVAQVPGVDFTVSGTTLTFTTAPANAADIIARGFGVPAPVTTVSDGSVTTAKVADGAITHSKLHTTAIQDKLGYTPVSPTQLTTAISNLVDSAPGALDTLNELAAALGDDANYASTITTALSTKADTSSLGTLASVSPTGTPDNTKFLRGDNSWQVVAVTPTAVSDQSNTSTGYFDLPSGTTAQRPSSPNAGYIRYNTTLSQLELYDGSEWVVVKSSFAATGGSVTDSAGYRYHTFTSSGTFTVTKGTNNIQYLVVAGGGGSTGRYGGGGGAGGYIASTALVSSGNISITIGGGGAAGGPSGQSSRGDSGSNTSVSGLISHTAIGGGAGGATDGNKVGLSGGSGGGGANGDGSSTGLGGAGTAGQGFSGGYGLANGGSYDYKSGGGGGAGANGANGNTGTGIPGKGGDGLQWLNGNYYAGGGSGGSHAPFGFSGRNPGGLGGGGGSGNANSKDPGENGTANTGGGGGGYTTTGSDSAGYGGSGGSGIVIIRYQL